MSSVGIKAEENLSKSGTGGSVTNWKQMLALTCLLVVAPLAIYWRVNAFPFVNYDDTIYVTQNTEVQSGLNWNTVHWAFTTFDIGTWHPVTWMSHALDCQLFDVDPAGPHDVNLLLHVINSVLLFWVLSRATSYVGRSFIVAALFAVHPVNVESVVWIAERKNSLSMLFFLLALGAYRWYVAKPKLGRYATVATLFALGLMAKPQVITFPFILLLWDYWPLHRISFNDASSWRKRAAELVWEKVPLFALSGMSATLTMAAQRADGNKISYAWTLRVGYALVSYVQYIGKALWPTNLAAFYPHPDVVATWQVAGAALLLVFVTAGVLASWRVRPYLAVGWFFFLGTLVPRLGLEGVGYQGKQGIADRYAYLPMIGSFVMICWGIAEFSKQKSSSKALLPVVSVIVLAALAVTAYIQVGYWRDNVTLWTHATEVTKGNFLAENNLGKALLAEGRTQEGIAHFFKAAEIYPDDPVSNLNIGIYEQKQGHFSAALERYNKTISITRDNQLKIAALMNMATCYRGIGNYSSAQRCEAQALELRRQGRL